MKFEELDNKMRVYEQAIDQVIPPDVYLIARLDGRNFTRLTKERCQFEAPFDVHFRDMMVQTVKDLMECGFRVIYGYTQSDEISLLFHKEERTFGRKVRKFNSILAGEASAAFSLQLGQKAVMDCRVIPLPNKEKVIDYFLWRQEDAARNALNAHCYWMLRKEGLDVHTATDEVAGKSIAEKNEMLYLRGIKFNDLPAWQKRGIGIVWGSVSKTGFNPLTGQEVMTSRRGLQVNYELPRSGQYEEFLARLLDE